MRRGNVRVLVLLALSFIVGLLLSAVVAGASVQCPPDMNSDEKISVAPISPKAFKDLVEKHGAMFTDERGILLLLTLADVRPMTVDVPIKDTEIKSVTGVFALVQGFNSSGALSTLQCFFVGTFLTSEK